MPQSNAPSSPRRREKLAWLLVALQACFILLFLSPSSVDDDDGGRRRLDAGAEGRGAAPAAPPPTGMNGRPNAYYERKQRRLGSGKTEAGYDPPTVHDASDARFARRIWRSVGSPVVHPDLRSGSCWCSADDWCACTPALAVDVVLRSGDDHLWVVRRAREGMLALVGGFTEVGETSEECVRRELMEETGLELDAPPVLLGVYNDPRRDARRHSTSVVYVADVPEGAVPRAGDDAKEVIRLPVADIDKHEYFVDHKTILHDYVAMVENRKRGEGAPRELEIDGSEPFKRSVCPM